MLVEVDDGVVDETVASLVDVEFAVEEVSAPDDVDVSNIEVEVVSEAKLPSPLPLRNSKRTTVKSAAAAIAPPITQFRLVKCLPSPDHCTMSGLE
jgi:hypothetical protein